MSFTNNTTSCYITLLIVFVAASVNGLPAPKYDGNAYGSNTYCESCGTINLILKVMFIRGVMEFVVFAPKISQNDATPHYAMRMSKKLGLRCIVQRSAFKGAILLTVFFANMLNPLK